MNQPNTAITRHGKLFEWSPRNAFACATSLRDLGVEYRDAAKDLFLTGRVHPMVFNYHHAIEVYIKAILIDFNSGLTPKDVTWRKHDLSKQMPDLKRVAGYVGLGISEATISAINQLNETDRKSVAFRYNERLPQGHLNCSHFSAKAELVLDELEALYDACSENLWQTIKQEEGLLVLEVESDLDELEAPYDACSESLWQSVKQEEGIEN
jgi:HEPN domain-containing protein